MESIGPPPLRAIADSSAFHATEIEIALAQLEAEGQVLRGRFTRSTEWRDGVVQPARAGPDSPHDARPVAARNRAGHRSAVPLVPDTLAAAARASSCTAPMECSRSSGSCRAMRFRRPPGSRRYCRSGLRRYEPELLDELCLSGEVMWARVSPHPALEEAKASGFARRGWRRYVLCCARMPRG